MSAPKRITPRQLGKLLAPYQISSRNIEIYGVQRKGFDKHLFEEAWQRYNVFSSATENAVRAVHFIRTVTMLSVQKISGKLLLWTDGQQIRQEWMDLLKK